MIGSERCCIQLRNMTKKSKYGILVLATVIFCFISCNPQEKNRVVYMLDGLDIDTKSKSIKKYTLKNTGVDLDIGYEVGNLLLEGDGLKKELGYMKFSCSKTIYLFDWKDWRVNKLNEPGVSIYHFNKMAQIFQKEGLEFTGHNVASIWGISGIQHETKNDKWYLELIKSINFKDDTISVRKEDIIQDCDLYFKRVAYLIDSLSNSYEEFIIPLWTSSYYQQIFFTKPIGNALPIAQLEFYCNCYSHYKVDDFKHLYL